MKITLFSVGIIVTILLLAMNVYAQPLEEIDLALKPLINLSPYRIQSFEEDQDALETFLNQVAPDQEISTDSPINKMGLGFINTTCAWTDIPRQVSRVSQRHNLFLGVTMGFTAGLISGLERQVSGALDIATCSFPPYNESLMKPEYKVRNPDDGFKIELLKW